MKPLLYLGSDQPDRLVAQLARLTALYPAGRFQTFDLPAFPVGLPPEAPDVVVLDLAGSNAAGATWCKKLKAHPAWAGVPVIVMAAEPTESADGYLKPGAEDAEIVVQLRTLVRLKQHEDALREQEQRMQAKLEKRSLTLRETEHRFRMIFEASPDAVFVEDENGVVLDVNPAACRMHGLSKNRLVGLHVAELVPPAQRDAVVRDFPLWFSGALQIYEGFSYTSDARIIPVELKASRIEYQNRPALLLIARDISERRSSEDRRSAAVQGLRAIVEIADDLIACPDVNTLYRQAVELARQRLGLERSCIFLSDGLSVRSTFGTNMKGETTDERAHRLPMDATWRERFRLRSQNEPRWSLSLEHLQDWQDGIMRPYEHGWVAITPIQTASKPVGVFCNDAAISRAPFDPVKQEIVAVYCSLLANIMERKAAETERGRLAMAVEQSAEAVLISDLNGTIDYVNPAFERITGYSAREALGLNPRFLKSGRHDVRFYEQMWSRLRAGDVWTGRITNRRKDGTLYEAEQTISPMRDGRNAVVGYLVVSQDVTRSVQLENELRQAQKMDSIGRLAGGIAHDFNNLLTGILGFARVVLEDLGPDHPSRPDLDEVLRAAERAAKLTRQLQAFGHKQVIHIQPIDLNTVVMSQDELLRRTVGENIELVTLVGEPLRSIEVDPGLLEQVILNLAVNARDAMPQGGKLTLSAVNVVVDEQIVQRHPEVVPGDYVLLTVKDSGKGMTDAIKQQAFEPFFTTKEKGRGLGLSTVYGIVKQFGGFVELESAVDRGTEIRLYFPTVAQPAQAQTAEVALPMGPGGETILVVEDENTVRRLVHRMLTGLGYTVLEARNGDDALTVFDRHAGTIDLVLTDVIMPRLGGPELVARLRQKTSGLKILYMSGYTEDVRMEGLHVENAASLILKPFTRESLAAEVRRVLDGK
jgi:PAS domain S-box-containing protein